MIGILNIAQQAYSRYSHPPRAIPASLFMRNEEFGLATKDGDGNYIYTNIPFDLLIDESHELDFDITDHAVENGSTISDHVQQRLRTVKITGMSVFNAGAGRVPLTSRHDRSSVLVKLRKWTTSLSSILFANVVMVYALGGHAVMATSAAEVETSALSSDWSNDVPRRRFW